MMRAHGCCFWHRNHQLPNSQINLCLKITWFAVLLGIYTVSSFYLHLWKSVLSTIELKDCVKCNVIHCLIYVTLSSGLHSSIEWMKKRRFIFRYWLRFHLTWIIQTVIWKIKTHAKYEFRGCIKRPRSTISNVWYIIIVRIKNTLVSLNLL